MNIFALPSLLLYMELGMIVISALAMTIACLLIRSARHMVEFPSRPPAPVPYTPLTRERRTTLREVINI